MKIYFSDEASNGSKLTNTGFLEFLRKDNAVDMNIDDSYDLIFNMSAFEYKKIEKISEKYPNIPVVNYVWDFYKWAYEGKHKFDWKGYGEFLKKSKLIIVPSSAQQLRLKELLGIDSVVVKTGHSMFEVESKDKRYVLDHMRWYPEENEKWIETACKTQYITVEHSEHKYPRDEFELLVGHCTFLACGYREASTGGLTILEGLWNGKPVLLSNSPYQGGKDYAGEFATYFQYDDYNDCKKKVKEMFENPPKIDIEKVREYIRNNFTYEIMANNLEKEFKKICKLQS